MIIFLKCFEEININIVNWISERHRNYWVLITNFGLTPNLLKFDKSSVFHQPIDVKSKFYKMLYTDLRPSIKCTLQHKIQCFNISYFTVIDWAKSIARSLHILLFSIMSLTVTAMSIKCWEWHFYLFPSIYYIYSIYSSYSPQYVECVPK